MILKKWLIEVSSTSPDGMYRHSLLKENPEYRQNAIKELKKYIDNAHEDARKRLREIAGYNLDPLEREPQEDPTRDYPQMLHLQTRKGYFGEIFAGLFAENFDPFDEEEWEIPIYLFRYHLTEFQQLERIRQTGLSAEVRPGRTGEDCLAFKRDEEGKIIKTLCCEAKCTKDHDSNMINDAHQKASQIEIVDLPQLIEVLNCYNDEESKKWVAALRTLWLRDLKNNDRYDLISYVCGQQPIRKKSWISSDLPNTNYNGGRKLQAVEVHLNDVEELVNKVYDLGGSDCETA